MDNKSVYGSYADLNKASQAVEELLEQGLESDDIAFMAKEEVIEEIDSPFQAFSYEKEKQKAETSSPTFRENLVNFLKGNNEAKFPYPEYEADLIEGKILILVSRELNSQGEIERGALGSHEIGQYKDKIKLHEERLHINKTIEEDSRVRIEKKVVEEIQKIEVPVRREELHVSRIKVDENGNEIPGSQEIEVLPLSHESPVVEKEILVTGEADIEKNVYRTVERTDQKVLKENLLIDERDEGKAKDLYIERDEKIRRPEEE